MSQSPTCSSQTESDCPKECPKCGSDVYREPMCIHGGPNETTSGWACHDCHWYELDDPDHAGREPSLAEDRVDLGRFGTHSTEDDGFDGDRKRFRLEDACPKCEGPLEFSLRVVPESKAVMPNEPKYVAQAEQCLGSGCQPRVP
jgi:hypothetical protein